MDGDIFMAIKVFEGEQLNLTEHIAQKFKGRRIEFIETNEGVLIKTVEDPIKQLRGLLKESKFTAYIF